MLRTQGIYYLIHVTFACFDVDRAFARVEQRIISPPGLHGDDKLFPAVAPSVVLAARQVERRIASRLWLRLGCVDDGLTPDVEYA